MTGATCPGEETVKVTGKLLELPEHGRFTTIRPAGKG